MATLPDVPPNTIIAIAVVAGTGIAALNAHLRSKLDTQIHDNYRHAKVVDANVHAGAEVASITEKSHRSA
jgi:hypothetical protein